MKNRRAILFFLAWSGVFAILLAFLPRGRRAALAEPRSGFEPIDPEAVACVEINRPAAVAAAPDERIVVARVDGRWRLESPLAAEADEPAVKRIIDAVTLAEPIDELSAADMSALGRSLRDFGLAAPRFSVTLTSPSRRVSYVFGRLTPSGKEVYVRRDEARAVFTVPAQTKTALACPVESLRRRRLFRFAPTDVEAIGLKNAGEPLSKLLRKDGEWRLVEPSSAPADNRVVAELVQALCDARILSYATPGGAHGLGDDEGYVLSLRDVFGNVEKAVLGAADGTNAVWALTPEGANVQVSAALKRLCRKRQKDVEDTRLFPVDAKAVRTFSVAADGVTYALSREAATAPWRMVAPANAPADLSAADRLLARALAIRSVDALPEGDGARLAFAIATAETNFPPCAVAVNFLPPDERLPDLHAKLIFRLPREKIRRIRVETAAGAAWDATASAPLLAAVEAGIVASRVEEVVMGAGVFERCGFHQPSYAIMVEMEDEASSMKKLLIGATAPGGGRFAIVGGSEAVFVLSPETVSLLTKPVETVKQ